MTRLFLTVRRGRLALAATAAAALAAGCSFASPPTAIEPYPPSDGTAATLELEDGGTVKLLNVLVVSAEEGAPGRVLGALSNDGSEPVTVSLTADFGDGNPQPPAEVGVEPGVLTVLGEGGEDVTLPAVPVAPGSFVAMTAQAGAAGTVQWNVPVMAPQYPYEGLAPTAAPTAG